MRGSLAFLKLTTLAASCVSKESELRAFGNDEFARNRRSSARRADG
jgi:hypothetical protein